jgi:hypothetical protein
LFPFFFARAKKKPNPKEESTKGCRFRGIPCITGPLDTLNTVSGLTEEADNDILYLALST